MEKIDILIKEGQTFNFKNNSYHGTHGTYTRASNELLSWIATVEDFIRNNYGEESSAFRLYQNFNPRKLNGNYEKDFIIQMNILLGALKTCKNITPKIAHKQHNDHQIIQLIKNVYFWTTIVVLSGGAFALGRHFGSSKFDKEKSDYYDQIKSLKTDTAYLHRIVELKDSTILQKDSIIAVKNDSLTSTNKDINTLYLLLGKQSTQ